MVLLLAKGLVCYLHVPTQHSVWWRSTLLIELVVSTKQTMTVIHPMQRLELNVPP